MKDLVTPDLRLSVNLKMIETREISSVEMGREKDRQKFHVFHIKIRISDGVSSNSSVV
jgi:hypothetical protein